MVKGYLISQTKLPISKSRFLPRMVTNADFKQYLKK